ncbi:MAG: hypothetical protein HOI23_03320 [Deltaproteobacteria bacterium]|jgi:hypothetical protein|nr:hypothetical protein [Deltaproteobacteria bacterium]MBT6433501.1 hypothetical protein [Deltaproteobacteria bacterium]
MKWFSLFVIAMVWGGLSAQTSRAANARESKAWSLIAFEREDFPPAQLTKIEHMVEGGTVDEIHVHVLQEDLERIGRWPQKHRLVVFDLQTLRPQNLQKNIGGDYHTPETMRSAMESMIAQYPELARISVIGHSVDGRPIDAIVVSDNISKRELDEPCLRMVAAYHGDEWASTEVAMATAWALLGRYETGSAIQTMVDRYEFWIIPILNPDGFVAFDRRNANRVDLNRNFSWAYEQTSQSGDHPFSEPETLALYDLSMTRAFHHNLSVHSGAVNLGWVWNYQETVSPDEAWFQRVGEKYLATTSAPDFWITNGAQWYMVNGESTDWLYATRSGHDYTLEVSIDKAPPTRRIVELVEQHLESTLGFYEQPGLQGRVTTTLGEPVEASITLGQNGSAMFSDPRTGAYYRPLSPGTYDVTASSLGFSPVRETLVIGEGEVVVWNPTLAPLLDIEIERFGVLSNTRSTGVSDDSYIDSEALASLLKAGATLELYRVGINGSYRIPLRIDGARVFLELNDLNRTLREQRGFWDLLLKDSSGEAIHRFGQAVFLVDTFPNEEMASDYSLEKTAAGRYIFQGVAQEPGTELVLLGPQLRVGLPSGRMPYEPGYFKFELSGEALEPGDWHLRLSQSGVFKRVPWLIRNNGTELSLIEVSKMLSEEQSQLPSSQGGCTCQSSQPMGWILLFALGLRLMRRRHVALFNEAR